MKKSLASILPAAAFSLLLLAGTGESDAVLLAHWQFNEAEADLTNNNNGTWNGVAESTGTHTSQIWSSSGSSTLTAGLVGNGGYYNFGASAAPSFAINTGTTSLLPPTGDFTVLATIRRDGVPASNEYILSNNTGQQGRLDFGFIEGNLFVFINGELNAETNLFLDADVSGMVFDNQAHTVGFSRNGTSGEIHLLVDGNSVASDIGFAQISTTQLYTIARRRGSPITPYFGEIADFQVHDAVVIPEPGTVALLTGLGALLVVARRARRRE